MEASKKVEAPIKSEPISKRGQNLYERELRGKVESEENIGKIIVIDVNTGHYAIDEDGLVASRRLREEHPDADGAGVDRVELAELGIVGVWIGRIPLGEWVVEDGSL